MKKSPTKSRMRRDPLDARSLILESAIRCIAKYGFHETSFQKIADASEMKQTAVIYHFKSKAQLLKAIIGTILESNRSAVATSTSARKNPVELLRAHFEGNLHWALTYPDQAKIILLFYYHASFDPGFTALYRSIRVNAVLKIKRILGAGNQDLAVLAHDILLGSIVNCLSVGATRQAQAQCRKSWRTFFLVAEARLLSNTQ